LNWYNTGLFLLTYSSSFSFVDKSCAISQHPWIIIIIINTLCGIGLSKGKIVVPEYITNTVIVLTGVRVIVVHQLSPRRCRCLWCCCCCVIIIFIVFCFPFFLLLWHFIVMSPSVGIFFVRGSRSNTCTSVSLGGRHLLFLLTLIWYVIIDLIWNKITISQSS